MDVGECPLGVRPMSDFSVTHANANGCVVRRNHKHVSTNKCAPVRLKDGLADRVGSNSFPRALRCESIGAGRTKNARTISFFRVVALKTMRRVLLPRYRCTRESCPKKAVRDR